MFLLINSSWNKRRLLPDIGCFASCKVFDVGKKYCVPAYKSYCVWMMDWMMLVSTFESLLFIWLPVLPGMGRFDT